MNVCWLSLSFGVVGCTGMLHTPNFQRDVETTATFSLLTMSDYDEPYAEWAELTTDENFMSHECLVERTDQITDEVTESGIWETCTSPYDLTEAPGIDVTKGFNGRVTVRSVSMSGQAGSTITKKFRRAIWARGLSGSVLTVTTNSSSDRVCLGGGFSGPYKAETWHPHRFVRLEANGTVDLSAEAFLSGFDQQVNSSATQEDGRIIVGGDFTSYRSIASAPDYLVRLNTDGTFDSTFTGNISGFNARVNKVYVQTDGKILVGGNFTTYNGSASAPDRLVRLNVDGSIDSSFNGITTGFDSVVRTIEQQHDGKVIIGGDFASYNGNASAPNGLIRLNTDGSVDSTFTGITTGFNGSVVAVRQQDDGKILVAGSFTSYNGNASVPDRIIRLNSDGSVDSGFTATTGFDDQVNEIQIQTDGKILVGGAFTSYNGDSSTPNALMRLNSDGSVDSSFSGITSGFSSFGASIYSIQIRPGGKLLVGGNFYSYNDSNDIPLHVIALNSNGSIDDNFLGLGAGFNSLVSTIEMQANGKILIGGAFTEYNQEYDSVTRNFSCFDSTNGITLDIFQGNTGFDGFVNTAIELVNGSILVAGEFLQFDGTSIPTGIAQLNSGGEVNSSLSGATSGFDTSVWTADVQTDGKFILGGSLDCTPKTGEF